MADSELALNRFRLGEFPPEDPNSRVGEGGVWRCESTSLPAVGPALLQLGGAWQALATNDTGAGASIVRRE